MEEHKNIKEKGMWKKVSKRNVAMGKSALRTKWVFKTKNNEQIRARLVVLGYSQVPGVVFTELHSPVANAITIQLMAALATINNWDIEQINV